MNGNCCVLALKINILHVKIIENIIHALKINNIL